MVVLTAPQLGFERVETSSGTLEGYFDCVPTDGLADSESTGRVRPLPKA